MPRKETPEYGFKPGSRISLDPQKTGEALEIIRAKHGRLTPEIFLEEAKNPKHYLHSGFNWDDEMAAHEHRLWQARAILRAVVVIKGNTQQSRYVRVKVETGNKGTYEPIEQVVQSVDLYQSALSLLLQKLSSAQRAVQELREAADSSDHKDKLAMISIVVKALETASSTVKSMARNSQQ